MGVIEDAFSPGSVPGHFALMVVRKADNYEDLTAFLVARHEVANAA